MEEIEIINRNVGSEAQVDAEPLAPMTVTNFQYVCGPFGSR